VPVARGFPSDLRCRTIGASQTRRDSIVALAQPMKNNLRATRWTNIPPNGEIEWVG
jgi:hypothetical protein